MPTDTPTAQLSTVDDTSSTGTENAPATRTAWPAVLVLMATSFVLVTSEFLPPSLLPAMASALDVTEGQAGQTVTATAIAGFLIAPTIGLLFPRLDRRNLLVALALAATVSNLVVAISGNLILLLIARLLLGAAIGGFWAMALAIAARISAPHRFGRAVMLINTGTTMATVAGVPLGLWLGSVTDWRIVFVVAAAATIVVAAGLRVVLPNVPAAASSGIRVLGETLKTPGIAWALVGHVLTVMAHFTAFTYVRAALDRIDLDAGTVALLLAIFGIGGVTGNIVIGLLVDRHLRWLRFAVPLLLGATIAVIAAAPANTVALAVVIGVWGFAFGAWLPVLTTWMARVVPDRMEAGGGLVVAGFQLAITLGAAAGGAIVDGLGVTTALVVAAVAALVGGVLFGTARTRTPERTA